MFTSARSLSNHHLGNHVHSRENCSKCEHGGGGGRGVYALKSAQTMDGKVCADDLSSQLHLYFGNKFPIKLLCTMYFLRISISLQESTVETINRQTIQFTFKYTRARTILCLATK